MDSEEKFKNEILSKFAGIKEGMNILEIGYGAHAIATVPLAYMVRETGRIIAVDLARWTYFEEIVKSAGLWRGVIPMKIDAQNLPFPFKSFDLAVLIH